MTWTEAQYSLQVMAEAGFGREQRAAILQAKAEEDAAAAASAGALEGLNDGPG